MRSQCLEIPTFLVPSFMGDIRLERLSPNSCRVIVAQATVEEQTALRKLSEMSHKKKWLPAGASIREGETIVQAPIERIGPILAKHLRPGKAIVSAVKFSNGRIEELRETTLSGGEAFGQATADITPPGSVPAYQRDTAVPESAVPTPASKPTPEPASKCVNCGGPKLPDLACSACNPYAVRAKPVVATSVAAPARGCPPPKFSPARLRAWKVLMTFLTPEQREDFCRYDSFVVFGGLTGHRYMVTSRLAADRLRKYQRSLYDLDEKRAICTHDHGVPPEEELHALSILVQLPGRELWLREMT